MYWDGCPVGLIRTVKDVGMSGVVEARRVNSRATVAPETTVVNRFIVDHGYNHWLINGDCGSDLDGPTQRILHFVSH
jgi:hypothetical protein